MISLAENVRDIPFYNSSKNQEKKVINPDFSKEEPSSKINDIVQIAFDNLHSFARIDLTIKDVFLERSSENIRRFMFHASQIILIGGLFTILPVVDVISTLAISLFFLSIVFSLKKESISSFSFSTSYPINTAIKYIFFGAISFLFLGPTQIFIQNTICIFMESMGIPVTVEQDIGNLITSPGFLGLFVGLYAGIGAPIIEEILFREIIQEKVFSSKNESSQDKMAFFWQKTQTILKTAFIFGIVHGTVTQGWANIPIIICCFIMGIFLSLLKELTGDLWAPTTLHAVNNTLATLQLWKVI